LRPLPRLLRAMTLLVAAMALVVTSAGVAGASETAARETQPGNSAATLTVTVDGCTVTVTSDKDISNVKFVVDGSVVEQGPFGETATLTAPFGTESVTAKSGTTEFESTPVTCEASPTADDDSDDGSDTDTDDGDDDGEGPGNSGSEIEIVEPGCTDEVTG